MTYIKWGWDRRQSILQQGVVLVAGLLFAGATFLAIDGGNGAGAASTAVTDVSASLRVAATGLSPQQDAASQLSGLRRTASQADPGPTARYHSGEADRRAEVADRLRRQGDVAWLAGDHRAAGALYRQSWAVMPDRPPLMAAELKRWEIAERLQRDGDAAWLAGDVNGAASLYHQSQAVLP